MSLPRLIAVMGTTASGKTDLAEALADRLDAHLINADAFQVYRRLDIGTAKSDRRSEYSLINFKDPREPFGVGEWTALARSELTGLFAANRSVVVVGGTGLYIRALFEEYDQMMPAPDPELRERLDGLSRETLLELLSPEECSQLDVLNRVRVQRAVERKLTDAVALDAKLPAFVKTKFMLDRSPDDVHERIGVRTRLMLEGGWIDEVRSLMRDGYSPQNPGMRAHGYRHIWSALEGTIDMAEAESLTTGEVRRYAKRQRTWLRAEPRLIRLEANDALQQAVRYLE
jgi:tRNA dimethylallyltransferase